MLGLVAGAAGLSRRVGRPLSSGDRVLAALLVVASVLLLVEGAVPPKTPPAEPAGIPGVAGEGSDGAAEGGPTGEQVLAAPEQSGGAYPRPPQEADDDRLATWYRGALEANGVRIESLEVIDSRELGGGRVATVSIRCRAPGDLPALLSEVGAILRPVGTQVVDLDSVAIVVGDQGGNALSMVAVRVRDAREWFSRRLDDRQFIARWVVTDL